MAAEDTPVSAAHFAYLAERTRGDDAFLTELKAAARQAGLPPIWIGPAQVRLMTILLRLMEARRVLEVGTLAGSSAIALARALPRDGLLTTIELLPEHADFAARWIARSDVAERIRLRVGRAGDVLRELPDASLDAMLLDADKSGYPDYLAQARRLLRPGGLLMADNAFAFGQLFDAVPTDPEVAAVRHFNDLMAEQEWLQAVIVPLGDGLWVGVSQPG